MYICLLRAGGNSGCSRLGHSFTTLSGKSSGSNFESCIARRS